MDHFVFAFIVIFYLIGGIYSIYLMKNASRKNRKV